MKNTVSLICSFLVLLNGNSSRVLSIGSSIADLTKERGTLVKASALKPPPGNYKLVWADEFSTDGPVNSENWSYETGFVRNEENQWYQPENAFCKNGFLIIEAKKTHEPNPNYDSGSKNWAKNRQFIDYTSAAIETAGKKSWRYGRFVMRGRINTAMGLWPAFWTLGEKGEWPSNGEIDIMEFYNHNLLANIAVGTATPYHALWYSTRKPVATFNDKQWTEKFHIWRMDWDKDSIALFVDDILLNKVAMKQLYNRDGSGINPFNQPHFMLLNLAVGGLNGGDPSATAFPNRFEVDYVRVYQKKAD